MEPRGTTRRSVDVILEVKHDGRCWVLVNGAGKEIGWYATEETAERRKDQIVEHRNEYGWDRSPVARKNSEP